ncbi:MAG: energy transducer TonB [Bacteroidales bacterium]|nr:energy transducer TonB [Bacteroidales bacterium]
MVRQAFVLVMFILVFAGNACGNTFKPDSLFHHDGGEPIFLSDKIDQMPAFPGGDDGRIKFLINNVQYPQEACENGEQGTVYCSFVVEKDGSLTDIKILRGISESLDKEVLRVLSLSPKWNPGVLAGENVRVQFNMPLKFTLAGNQPKKDKKSKKKKSK